MTWIGMVNNVVVCFFSVMEEGRQMINRLSSPNGKKVYLVKDYRLPADFPTLWPNGKPKFVFVIQVSCIQ